MTHETPTGGPLVTVLVPTFNRRGPLREALDSLVAQTYAHFEAFVINDGGEPVRDIVEAFADPRLTLIDRRENRGKAASLNEALDRARGTYVAYLDDDDLFYPRHLQCLVEALEADGVCGVAYTDLYKVHCRVLPDGTRQVLGKVVNVCRDFDRFFLCYFNHTLHVSLMHRRDLLARTGPYDESLGILIDWDMTRRLAFFSDFLHVPEVTGEFYAPVAGSDRISEKGRADRQAFVATTLKIRTARPPKPWPKMPDLTIVALPDGPEAAGTMIRNIYAWTFMPFQVLLPMPEASLGRLRIRMPNFVPVPTAAGVSREARLAAALERAEGDYAAVVPPGVTFQMLWVEDALHAATLDDGRTAFALPGPQAVAPAFVLPTAALARVLRGAAGRPMARALADAGIVLRAPRPDEYALRFDRALQDAQRLEENGAWERAAGAYRDIADRFGNALWMHQRRVRALVEAGRDGEALDLCRDLNRRRPTVGSLLLEARIYRQADRLDEAIERLEQARRWLAAKGTPCN